jgi:hypothetical protein
MYKTANMKVIVGELTARNRLSWDGTPTLERKKCLFVPSFACNTRCGMMANGRDKKRTALKKNILDASGIEPETFYRHLF